MLRASLGTVKARMLAAGLAIALGTAGLSGCYWSRYPRLMETHLTVLLDFADKLATVAADGGTVPPERWGEFTYPLERARDFSRIAARRFPDRRSLASFDHVLDLYGDLVADPRILARPDASAEIARRLAELRTAAAATRTDLAHESS